MRRSFSSWTETFLKLGFWKRKSQRCRKQARKLRFERLRSRRVLNADFPNLEPREAPQDATVRVAAEPAEDAPCEPVPQLDVNGDALVAAGSKNRTRKRSWPRRGRRTSGSSAVSEPDFGLSASVSCDKLLARRQG